MGEQSELGPLDLPLREHPTKGGIGPLSALDGIKPLSYLFSVVSNRAIEDLGVKIRDATGLSIKECISHSLKFSSDYLKPITSQLDPWILNMCQRSLQIATIYGENLLKNYMFKDNKIKAKSAEDVAYQLVYGFPTHSFAICKDIAKNKLGLNIIDADNYNQWERISNYYIKFLKNIKVKIIKITSLKEIDKACN